MFRRWSPWLLALALVVSSSCGKKALTTQPATESVVLDPTQELHASHYRDAAEIIGKTQSGALYALYRPERWNGDLVLYAHGFTAPTDPIQLPPIEDLRDQLLAQRVAVAYSSFSENGLAVKEGIRETENLEELFSRRLGQPRRVFLIGSSMGGDIALALAERHPEDYDGVLTECGLIGGSQGIVDYIAHVRVLFDVFYPGVLQGDLYYIPPGLNLNQHVIGPAVQAMSADPQGAAIISQLVQTPVPFSNGQQLVGSIVQTLALHFVELEDLLDRTGGDFFDNSHVTYSGPLPAPVLADINARVARYCSSRQAQEYLERNYETTGRLRIPMIALSNQFDPVVPGFNETRYRELVARRGDLSLLDQRTFAGRYGHTDMISADEVAQAFEELARRAGKGHRHHDDDDDDSDSRAVASQVGVGAGW